MARPRSNSTVMTRELYLSTPRVAAAGNTDIPSFPSGSELSLGSNPHSDQSSPTFPISAQNSSSSITYVDFEASNGMPSERSDQESNTSSLSMSDPNFRASLKSLSHSDPLLDERRQMMTKEEAEKNFKKAISNPSVLENQAPNIFAAARDKDMEKQMKKIEKAQRREGLRREKEKRKEEQKMERYVTSRSSKPNRFISSIGSLVGGSRTSPKGLFDFLPYLIDTSNLSSQTLAQEAHFLQTISVRPR